MAAPFYGGSNDTIGASDLAAGDVAHGSVLDLSMRFAVLQKEQPFVITIVYRQSQSSLVS
jgi:hypothetical protein